MKIVVEAGATKSDWRFLRRGAQNKVLLPGMNVSTADMQHNLGVLTDGLAAAGAGKIDGFYLYTAGILTPQVRSLLCRHIRSLAQVDDVDIQDDLVAAARAACGHSEGIVAILGTGSNACFWDGDAVSFRVRSGGYVIGDEGGGAALGKQFLGDFIKGLVPADVAADFAARFDATYEGIVAGVYRSASPAGYLGSIAPFLREKYGSSDYVTGLIESNFRSFIERSLLPYDVSRYEVGVVGGWGNACREIFTRLCSGYGIRIRTFEAEPIAGLVKYHSV